MKYSNKKILSGECKLLTILNINPFYYTLDSRIEGEDPKRHDFKSIGEICDHYKVQYSDVFNKINTINVKKLIGIQIFKIDNPYTFKYGTDEHSVKNIEEIGKITGISYCKVYKTIQLYLSGKDIFGNAI